MKSLSSTLKYLLAGIIVVVLGSLGGWYAFVHKQVAATTADGVARGFGTNTSFGSPAGSSYQNLSGDSAGGSVTGDAPAPRLWHVSKTPVAGAGFAASSSRLYFTERATGNTLEADPSISSITRRTNTLYAKIYHALFAPDGSPLLRSQSETGDITTFAGTIATSTDTQAPTELSGTYLPLEIKSISILPSKSLFFLVSNPSGGVVGVTSKWDGSSQKQIFASTLSQWRTQGLSDGTIYLVQKASDDTPGYAFRLKSGTLEPVANGPGLTVVPREKSTAIIYGLSSGGALNTFVKSDTSATPLRLSIQTVADKCVWAPGKDLVAYCAAPKTAPNSAHFLREWYRGALHTSDTWYRVDVSSGSSETLFTTDSSLELDVINPTIDESGTYISFMNADDASLWMLHITP